MGKNTIMVDVNTLPPDGETKNKILNHFLKKYKPTLKFSSETSRGTSLTIVNCIGFLITIINIQKIKILSGKINT